MQDIFVGRQPIFGPSLDVSAYELLFRGSSEKNRAEFSQEDQATSQVVLNVFTELGLERVVGARPVYLNVTRGFLTGEYPLPVPVDRVVLEVLEHVPPDPEVLRGLGALRERGFTIALDDFVLDGTTRAFLPHADVIKVDCLGLDNDQIAAQVEPLRHLDVTLLAEKIETQEQFEHCRDLGFELFQGFFLSRPNIVRGRAVAANRVNLLMLLSELQDPSFGFERAQELVSQDAALTYKLMRHVNTTKFGRRRRVESIHETLVFLGVETIRSLASLFLLASVDDKPHELLVTAMLRAKMCESLARRAEGPAPSQAFTVGLFSILDALMDTSMRRVLERLPLADELRVALLEREGGLGAVLASALAYERGDWGHVSCLELPRAEIKGAFLDAIDWVQRIDTEVLRRAA
ncbi:MAG: HDOD domain-containing protein [Planctomycetota bacterium]